MQHPDPSASGLQMEAIQPAPPVVGTPQAPRRRGGPAPRGRRVGQPLPSLPPLVPAAALAVQPTEVEPELLTDGAASPQPTAWAAGPLPGSMGSPAAGGAAPSATASRHVGGDAAGPKKPKHRKHKHKQKPPPVQSEAPEEDAAAPQTGSPTFSVILTRRFMGETDAGIEKAAAVFIQKRTRGHLAKMEVIQLIRGATRIQSRWRGLAARRLWMSMKRSVENMSWVLVCTTDGKSGNPTAETQELIRRIENKPLQVIHFPSPDRMRYYIAVSATDDDLVVAAEVMRLRMFLKPKKVFNPLDGEEVIVGGPAWFGGTCEYVDSARHEFIPASQLEAYINGTPPDENEPPPIPQDLGGPSFFNSGERQRITRYIIEQMGDKIDMEDAVERYSHDRNTTKVGEAISGGISRTFSTKGKTPASFDQHDSDEPTCLREFFPLHHDQEMAHLFENWASIGLIAKHCKDALVNIGHLRVGKAWTDLNKLVDQPIHMIRNYYGERVALYYAYVGACLLQGICIRNNPQFAT